MADDFHIDATVQSQYAASPHIVALVEAFWDSLNPDADLELIYNKMVNPLTAEGFGLDVWGRIVAIGREYLSADTENPYWGYEPPTGVTNDRMRNFGHAPYYKLINGKVQLTDSAYRTYIMLKAMMNIGDSTLSSLNYMIHYMFPNDQIAVVHPDTMTLRLVVQSNISQSDLDALLNLPWLPTGVGLEIYRIGSDVWGLEGSGLGTLDNSNFITADVVVTA